tara:strand:+ start:304 stop:1263 length:960 start_codon:yes stop_codon:yes gene_type:complete
MAKYNNQIIGVIGFIISIIFIFSFSNVVLIITNFAEKYLSQDRNIEGGIELIKANLILLIIIIIILSILFIFNFLKKVHQFINTFIDSKSIVKFVLTDDVCSKKQMPVYLFLISTISSLFLHSYLIYVGEPVHEGFLETYISSLFLISGIILLISNSQINKNRFPPLIKKKLRLILAIIAVILIFLFGEEISWGQRIFKLESFGLFSDYNYQNEINYHNFFNPLFPTIYPVFGLSSFIVLFFIWIFPKNRSFLFQLLIPPPSFIYIVFIMAGASFRGHSETFEELLAIFSLLYSIRILICLNSPNNKFKSGSFKNLSLN